MANTVVLGDLGKYKGDVCLRCYGGAIPNPVAGTISISGANKISIKMKLSEYYPVVTGARRLFGDYSAGLWAGTTTLNRFYIRYGDIDSGSAGLDVGFSAGDPVDLQIDILSNQITITVNGFSETLNGSCPMTIPILDVGLLFLNNLSTDYTVGDICLFSISVDDVIVLSHIKNDDFGTSILVDHSGNGNNGVINGAQWWKKDVDQNFATPQLLKDTLVSPLTEDQYVIYTDATPYYGSNDPFWNPYNQDATYSFTVVQQRNILQKLLQFGVFDMKPVTKTIIGTDIAGAGVVNLDFAVDHAKVLTTGTAGTLSVQFPEDPVGTFRTIEVTNDGIFIPVGQFTAIDRDASTVVFDSTLLLGA